MKEMGVIQVILITISAFMFIESLILILFPGWIRKMFRRMTKHKRTVRDIGHIELIIAILILLLITIF